MIFDIKFHWALYVLSWKDNNNSLNKALIKNLKRIIKKSKIIRSSDHLKKQIDFFSLNIEFDS